MDFERLLEKVLKSDPNIRHSIVTDTNGNTVAVNHRDGVTNYLSKEETDASLVRAANAWKGRKELFPKIGKALYAVAAFQKITRVTFPLGENNLLFVSLGSDEVRTDMHAGGQKEVIEHVLHLLDGDPTTS